MEGPMCGRSDGWKVDDEAYDGDDEGRKEYDGT